METTGCGTAIVTPFKADGLVDEPALWALVEIYRRLLERIEQRNYDVYSERIRLSVAEKLGVLCQGWIRRLT